MWGKKPHSDELCDDVKTKSNKKNHVTEIQWQNHTRVTCTDDQRLTCTNDPLLTYTDDPPTLRCPRCPRTPPVLSCKDLAMSPVSKSTHVQTRMSPSPLITHKLLGSSMSHLGEGSKPTDAIPKRMGHFRGTNTSRTRFTFRRYIYRER